ncbi:DUF4440 domain-containing protein [Moraxella sp.]|uniref:DUF4440 domain-containing protein n=1 Tax=Moraxella sp. TaxID=479 RepID=UPI0026DB6B7A|nr:DUF4440 domain-containing protein [Moraxella sp.]MDO4894283.1 DUF4440 domain-containing protein [Moraxella sp.]
MKQNTQFIAKIQTITQSALLSASIKAFGLMMNKKIAQGLLVGAIALPVVSMSAHAINESAVSSYAAAMNAAANNQNIAQVSKLIADDAVISITRNGKTSSLGKEDYLQLLQKSWARASNYRYRIDISDVVISGNQARAQVDTTETWTQDGKPITMKTSSRATLSQNGNNAVLLRSVAQMTVD